MLKNIVQFFLLVVLSLCVVAPNFAAKFARSDALLQIVTYCLDPSLENYCHQCPSPKEGAQCSGVRTCAKTTDVWASTEKYVAIRDLKMCGCPTEFVHGLAMPLAVVTGVEDSRRPEGIWQFAWDTAVNRIEPEAIALVVNPKGQRSQNQLHVHIVRLNQHARAQFKQELSSIVASLDHVWSTAAHSAATKGLADYGVLVTQTASQQFLVVVTANSPEAAFTIWHCK